MIENMLARHGFPLLTETTVDDFVQAHDHVVLFFSGNPAQYPESNDVAVILPELLKVFDTRLTAAVIQRDAEGALQPRYGFSQWPALVFLRRGQHLGTICRVQSWEQYVGDITGLLQEQT